MRRAPPEIRVTIEGVARNRWLTQLAHSRHMAEGATAEAYYQAIAIMSPDDKSATAAIDFQLADGPTVSRSFVMPAQRELYVRVDDIIPGAAVSAEARTPLPTLVEQTKIFEKGEGTGVHNAIGIQQIDDASNQGMSARWPRRME